jgi:HPt (histidine-containing phosphotransfer) domain-containing protein
MHENENALVEVAASAHVAAPGAGVAGAAIDRQVLARLGDLDPDGRQGLIRRVLQTYESTLGRQLQDLAQARACADVQQLGRIAHTLKSSSAAIGATALAQGCAAIEQGTRTGACMPPEAALDALVAQAQAVSRTVADILAA